MYYYHISVSLSCNYVILAKTSIVYSQYFVGTTSQNHQVLVWDEKWMTYVCLPQIKNDHAQKCYLWF